MRNILISLSLLLCCMVADAADIRLVSSGRACWLAHDIVGDTEDDYDYYCYRIALPDSVPTFEMNYQYGRLCWLVLVDEEPGSGWEHPCKYVYISSYESPTDFNYLIIDSVCPPDNAKLISTYRPNRYGEKATMKPYVPKILSNDPNPAAGNTYAVILNGGMCLASNNERYWNDCSFIYKTLRNTYGIPKPNIKVIMSDGTNEGNDLSMNVGGFASSPLDLDDDSIPDIEYAATKANLQTVLNEMAQKLTDDDHLMIFVTGHGGYDVKKQSSYLYLWNKMKLYPNELNNYLEPIDAGFISIVMGQCNSGGFIDQLKKPNRIIATACAENERSYGNTIIPFEEFLYHWTSALNGYDAYGEKVNVKENIPIMDAQAYAARNDVYANGKEKYGHEVPQINYFTHSVAYDLSLANIPPVVDLCFDKYRTPVTSELMTRSYKKGAFPGTVPVPVGGSLSGSHKDYDAKTHFKYEFWDNPYIWIRNQNDGKDVHVTENPIIEAWKPIFVYTQVRNKGVKPYKAQDMMVKSFWGQSATVITEYKWKGYSTNNKSDGGSFDDQTIYSELAPGNTTIVEMGHVFFSNSLTLLQKDTSNLCILAYITPTESDEGFPVDSNAIAAVWGTDKLGQSNVSTLELQYTVEPCDLNNLLVRFDNPYLDVKDWGVIVKPSLPIETLRSEANVNMRLSSDLITSWENGGEQSVAIANVDKNIGYFQIDGDSALLNNLQMMPHQSGKIGIKCNFFAENGITEKKTFDVNVAVKDNATGQILGGETFRIIQYPRPAINPQIETTKINGKTTLTATNVSENVIYKWYNEQGELVGEGNTFAVPAGVSASSYRVKAEALSDGAISYSAMEPAESSTIKSVLSDPSSVNVIFEGPANGGTTLRLASATGNAPVTEYSVEAGSTACNIPADNLASGVYQVTMVENGVVVGTKKFTK